MAKLPDKMTGKQIRSRAGARLRPVLIAAVIAVAAAPTAALAYIGPGAGLGALGSFFALVGAVFLGVLGFIWYPVKKLLRAMRKTPKSDQG